MTSERIEITALITPKAGKADDLRERIKQVVALTNEEPGCIEFRIFERYDKPGNFILWEIFENQKALDIHMDTDYTKAYFASGLVEHTEIIRQSLL